MQLPDSNVLLYAVNRRDPNHTTALDWLEAALNGTEVVGFAWLVLLAFLRISTLSRGFASPPLVADAADIVQGWLGRPSAVVVHPTHRHVAVLRDLLERSGTAGNLVSDAHLAALAVEHGAGVVSFDRDFLRFPGLRLTVPGAERRPH